MRAIGVHTSGQTIRVAQVTSEGAGTPVVRLKTLSAGTASGLVTPHEGSKGSACFASLPSVEVLTRVWMLPAVPNAKLRAMVGHRLEADLPIPLDQLEWDCRTMRVAQGNQTHVLAQAVRRERVSRLVELLRGLDLLPNTVTTEAEAIATLAADAFGLKGELENTTLVLAGEHEWLVAVLAGDMLRAGRRVSFDSAQPELAIREVCQVSETQPESPGVARVVWAGHAGAEESLQTVAEMLDVPLGVAVADIRDESGEPLSPTTVVEYAQAIGLALAALHKREHLIRLGGVAMEAAKGPQNRIERLLARPGRLAVCASVFLVLALGIQLLAMRSETWRIEARAAVASSRPADDLDTKVRAMQRLMQYRIDVEDIMSEVAKVLPDSTIISSVQLSRERRLVLKGTSKDAKAAFTLVEALRKSPRFTDVTPERSASGQGGEFTVTAEVTGITKVSAVGAGQKRGARWR